MKQHSSCKQKQTHLTAGLIAQRPPFLSDHSRNMSLMLSYGGQLLVVVGPV